MRLKNFFQSKFRVSRIISRICSKAKPYNHDLALALRSKHGVARYCVLFPVSTLFVSIPGYGQMSKILFPLWSLVSLDAVRVKRLLDWPINPRRRYSCALDSVPSLQTQLCRILRHRFYYHRSCRCPEIRTEKWDPVSNELVGALRCSQR